METQTGEWVHLARTAILKLFEPGRENGPGDGRDDRAGRLLSMARAEFPELSAAERRMLVLAACGTAPEEANASDCGADRVRAALLRWLCMHPDARTLVCSDGIQLTGATVPEPLDLSFVKVSFPLRFQGCRFRGINLGRAELRHVEAVDCLCGELLAGGVSVGGDFVLTRLHSIGRVELTNASIDGDLRCTDAVLLAPGELALGAAESRIGGSVWLNGDFLALGEVRLDGADISGTVRCEGGWFLNRGEDAFSADRVRVGGSVFLRDGYLAVGETRMLWAKVEGSLYCTGSRFFNPRRDALSLNGLDVRGNLFLNDRFAAYGETHLWGARVHGYLRCSDGRFLNPCGQGRGERGRLPAFGLNAFGSVVEGNATFLGTVVTGGVCLVGAHVGGSMDFEEACLLKREDAPANRLASVTAERLSVAGSLKMGEAFRTDGIIDLTLADVGGDLSFERARFEGAGVNGLVGTNLRVGGTLAWTALELAGQTRLCLSHATVGQLRDDARSWPGVGRLWLDGFTYHGLHSDSPAGWRERTSWLARDVRLCHPFHPQPYEQLVLVLRKAGYESDARHVAMERERQRLELGKLGWRERCWMRLLGCTIGYGYRPSRALVWMAGFILAGGVLFRAGEREGLMSQPKRFAADPADTAAAGRRAPAPGPVFDGLAYSVDVFLPVIDLHQEGYWLPSPALDCRSPRLRDALPSTCGQMLRWYHWFHIVTGWIFSTIAVVGFTGLVRKS